MKLPPTLIHELLKLNVDEADVSEIIMKTFNINDSIKPKIYAELSKISLERSCEFLNQGNLNEAIDKLCKAIELIVRSLGLSKGLDEATNIENKGKWTPTETERVAQKLGLHEYLSMVYSLYEKETTEKEVKEKIDIIKRIIINYYNN